MNRFGKLNVILLLAILIIFTSCKKKNNNTVVASSSLTTTNNNIKIANLRELPNENVEENEKTNVKNINDLNVAISTLSTLSTSKNKNQSKSNDILSKFFICSFGLFLISALKDSFLISLIKFPVFSSNAIPLFTKSKKWDLNIFSKLFLFLSSVNRI